MLLHNILFKVALLVITFITLTRANEDADLGNFELDQATFDRLITGEKAALVKFYAPWCGHCQAMAEDYRRLNKIVGKATDKVLVVKVNADKERALGQRFGVRGYPTLMWFPKGGDIQSPEKYHGGRDFNSMLRFIREHTNIDFQGVLNDRKYSVDVTLKALNDIQSSGKRAFVMFFAPWCGHCKAFKDNFEQIAKAFVNEKSSCVIAALDGSAERDASEKYLLLICLLTFCIVVVGLESRDSRHSKWSPKQTPSTTMGRAIPKRWSTLSTSSAERTAASTAPSPPRPASFRTLRSLARTLS